MTKLRFSNLPKSHTLNKGHIRTFLENFDSWVLFIFSWVFLKLFAFQLADTVLNISECINTSIGLMEVLLSTLKLPIK